MNLNDSFHIKLVFTIFLIVIIPASYAFPQIPGSPLHVSGNQLFDSDDHPFIIKAINLNDYIEDSYDPWGSKYFNQSFSDVLSWLHTEDDYTRIRKMGFNAVRVNICPSHFESIPDLQRIKQLIKWAKDNGLYLIIAYFAPPGSFPYEGYYSEWEFYYNENNKEKFRQHWKSIMKLCSESGFSHVLYEFLNEPQINYDDQNKPYKSRSYSTRDIYRGLMNNLLISLKDSLKDGSRVVIVDGLNYAKPDYRGFNYLYEGLKEFKNVVYGFHYYMDDFAFRGCNWKTGDKYKGYKGYITSNTGFDTVRFNFTAGDLNYEKSPDLVFTSFNQRGRYKLKYFDITDNSNGSIVIKLDLQNQQIMEDTNGKYILDNNSGRRFGIGVGGNWGSSVNSYTYLGDNFISISNSVKSDSDVRTSSNNCAIISYDNASWNRPFSLDETRSYIFRAVIDGDSLDDNGGFIIEMKKDGNPTTIPIKRCVQNLTWDDTDTNKIEMILSSHTDRIDAAFNIMKEFSDKYNVPVFLGEFGIPLAEKEPHAYTYFRDIMNNIEKYGFSWAFFSYREPHENNENYGPNLISFGLFSGRDKTPTASVCSIINGINTGVTSEHLNGYDYFCNRVLIDTLANILNGSFDPKCLSSGLENNNNNENIPIGYCLKQNYPNPFNPTTEINFSITKGGRVKLIVFNMLGSKVAVLIDEFRPAGNYTAKFNAGHLPSGTYIYRLESGSFKDEKKLMLIK
ncbi:MAG: cellulase family glycosylhydrolase [Ignavibacteria bacterium]|jgi:hypothetical protein|nr:cellulase family glycosylhydrolase [Ignavibacteria bacterium]MCU7504268.1 cellulase family glycosylhydrolase [Ignavibacteria bacterium]MCU7516113.1 cellulase family glycosylhydrolase [Ignavibacteria bacterium]